MGEQQEKKPLVQSWACSGLLELMVSPALPKTWLKRSFQSLTSLSLIGPALAGAPLTGACWAGTV